MSLAASIFSILTGDTGLAAVVGTRVFPVVAQSQIDYPYLVYTSIYANPQNSLSGWSGSDNTRLQIDVWAKTYLAAQDTAALVRTAMAQPNAAWRGVCIGQFDLPVDGGLDLYHVIVEFSLWSS